MSKAKDAGIAVTNSIFMGEKMDSFFKKDCEAKSLWVDRRKTKIIFSVFVVSLLLLDCGAVYAQNPTSDPIWVNTFKGIPVEVTGIPYEYKDICGNRTIDSLIETEYNLIATGWASSFVNFHIDNLVLDFLKNGELVLSTVYSYDRTPADNGAFYPAQSGRIHDWKLEPTYHHHSSDNCSLDFYNDIAISQAKLNGLRSDPSLGKVYDVLLSVAEDMDYNYPAIGRKAKFVTLPNGKEPLKGVCDDYSNLLVERLTAAKIKGVSNIQKVTGQNHAWVTLVYQGKTLYLDATWFDKNSIDEKGVVDHTPYKDPRDMTFDNEIFTNHNHHHIAGGTKNLGS